MVTRKEVAERAKVSVTAVSRTLNNSGYVAKEKREAILQAAAELGYHPNPIARSLKQQRTRQILFYCKDLSNSFNMELYTGMHEYARKREYMILMSGSLDFQQMNGMMIDGAVLPNDTIAEAYEKQGYCRGGLPVVSASYGVSLKRTRGIPYVDCDVYAAMENAVAYLREKGHTLIALATPYDVFAELGLSRQIAYINQMGPFLGKRLKQYVFDRYLNTYNPFAEEDFFTEGQRAAEEFVNRGSDATAVVCFNDEFALGMLKQFRLLDVRVPEDVSVMGIDGTRIRRYVTPSLTSVSLSAARQGAECIRVLLELIEGQHVRSLTPVPLGLIEGESVRDLTAPLQRKNHTLKKTQLSGGKALNIVSCFSFLCTCNNDIRYTFRTLTKTRKGFCGQAGAHQRGSALIKSLRRMVMKNHVGKRILAAVLTGAAACSLAACGGSSGGKEAGLGSGEAPASPEERKASISVGGWPSGDDGFKAALAGFNEKYPGIQVELDFTDTTSHHQALSTSLAAGTDAPDVAMVEGAYIAQYRDSAALTNLLPEPYNAEKYKEDFVALKWDQAYSVDGSRMVAIPWDVGPCTYFYRTDVFEECGLPTDPDGVAQLMSTWDGVLQAAEAVHKPGERWLVPSAIYFYQLMFCNRDYYNKDLTLKLDREGDTDCLDAIIQMRKNGWDMNVDMWSTEAYAAYQTGACASVATGGWFGGFLKTDIDPEGAGHWGVAELPGGIAHCNWGGSFLVIPEQSKNKDAAWAFVEYMLCTSRAQNEMLKAVDYFPAYMPAYEDSSIYEEEDPYFGGQKTKALWAAISKDLEPVFNTMMDVTAEGCIYSSVNAGLDQGLDAAGIKSLLASDIETATAELKNQQIQVYKDAGLWDQ